MSLRAWRIAILGTVLLAARLPDDAEAAGRAVSRLQYPRSAFVRQVAADTAASAADHPIRASLFRA